MRVLAVIPARYASTRFPGKPLVEISGKPMVQHVYEHCRAASGVDHVVVATEDERVVRACRKFGGDVELTSASHFSGTDRVAEVAARHPEFDAILNVQGDEPAMESDTISAVAGALTDARVQISSAMTVFGSHENPGDPNAVKVAANVNGDALYFSRAAIPCYRDIHAPEQTYYRHLGIYGFRRSVLLAVTQLPPSPLERAESLEQLRWMEAGYGIRCVIVHSRASGIDTPQDLESMLKSHRA
jgi:3-deoxy-manno-octulosonate cytidylyltransferase (CMP-KDO synthetase)